MNDSHTHQYTIPVDTFTPHLISEWGGQIQGLWSAIFMLELQGVPLTKAQEDILRKSITEDEHKLKLLRETYLRRGDE